MPARADQLVFAVSTGSAMPMTEFREGRLSGGMLKDFGDALGRELGMSTRYLLLPRKRVEQALATGEVDLLCDFRPEWLDGQNWQWTGTVFLNQMLVVGRTDTPPLHTLVELGGQRVGTVLGYRYPELDAALGRQLLRDDGVNDATNTEKLLNGRFKYMVSNKLYFDYQRMVHPGRARLNAEVFSILPFTTQCALPPVSRLRLDQVNRAIGTLQTRGEMRRIYARYRPANAG